jgi:hypothetical protein
MQQLLLIAAIVLVLYLLYHNYEVEQPPAETPVNREPVSYIVPGKYTLNTTSHSGMATIQRRALPASFTIEADGTVKSASTANVEFLSKTDMRVNGKILKAINPSKSQYNSVPPHISGYAFSYTRQ